MKVGFMDREEEKEGSRVNERGVHGPRSGKRSQ
ncbi:hypothetical protein JOC76_002582 [Neobacillus cucumis]|nr:hypothetical protein [Neobacillus cucumis]